MRVQFFSQLKEIVGTSEITLDLPDGASVADLLARLYREFPGTREMGPQHSRRRRIGLRRARAT